MASVTYVVSMTFSDEVKAAEILDAFCEEYGWVSPMNKQVFLKREIIEFVRLPWVKKKRKTAHNAADVTVNTEVNSVTIT